MMYMYVLFLVITLIGYIKGQPIYKDITNGRLCDTTHDSYEDLFSMSKIRFIFKKAGCSTD